MNNLKMWPVIWRRGDTARQLEVLLRPDGRDRPDIYDPRGKQGRQTGIIQWEGPGEGTGQRFPVRREGISPVPRGFGDQPDHAVFSGGGTSYLKIKATAYFMCQPVLAGPNFGAWVPLGKVTWSWTLQATWLSSIKVPNITTSTIIVSGKTWPVGQPCTFDPTTDFPVELKW